MKRYEHGHDTHTPRGLFSRQLCDSGVHCNDATAQPSTAVDSGCTAMQQAVPHVSAPIEKLAAAAMTGISSAKRNGTFGIRYISDNSEPHMKENSSVIECVPQFSLIMYVKM